MYGLHFCKVIHKLRRQQAIHITQLHNILLLVCSAVKKSDGFKNLGIAELEEVD